jgi:ribonuclease HII
MCVEAGVDEVGRGCLAGIVVAASVILSKDTDIPDLNDSKQLSVSERAVLKEKIMEQAVSYAIGTASVEEIDKVNILQATYMAMHRAIEQLNPVPELLLIDGNRFKKYADIPHVCIIKGDATYQNIAAASILAKVYRDEYMQKLAQQYPQYHWGSNVGYPTPQHIEAIRKYGYSPHHRKTFVVKTLQPTLF